MNKLKYSGIPAAAGVVDNIDLYNQIEKTLTKVTDQKRSSLKTMFDNFCTFKWREVDAFKTFGAFIVNKDALKFYNGPSFSNQYTKPQFEGASGQLTGVSFNVQKISFNVGVYWISEEHYRQLIYWLHPYEISTLTFDFEPDYYYRVKLAGIEDSIRHVIGHESVNNYDREITNISDFSTAKVGEVIAYTTSISGTENHTTLYRMVETKTQPQSAIYSTTSAGGYVWAKKLTNAPLYRSEPRYYTELKLTFEVQGDPCAYYSEQYDFQYITEQNGGSQEYLVIDPEGKYVKIPCRVMDSASQPTSDLAFPLVSQVALRLNDPEFLTLNGIWILKDKIDLSSFPSTQIFPTTIGDITNITNFSKLESAIQVQATQYPSTWRKVYSTSTGWNTEYGDTKIWVFNTQSTDDALLRWLLDNSIIDTTIKLSCSLTAALVLSRNGNDIVYSNEKTLFTVNLENLTYTSTSDIVQQEAFYLGYNSNEGILYWTMGESEYFLLSMLSTAGSGKRIVNSMEVNRFTLPGRFDDPDFDIHNVRFYLTLQASGANDELAKWSVDDQGVIAASWAHCSLVLDNQTALLCTPRTNLI